MIIIWKKKEELTQIYAPSQEEELVPETVSATKLDWKQQKEEQARMRKRENDLKKTEKAIEEWETRDKEIHEEMSDPTGCHQCLKMRCPVKRKSRNCRKIRRTLRSGKNWHSSQFFSLSMVYYFYG